MVSLNFVRIWNEMLAVVDTRSCITLAGDGYILESAGELPDGHLHAMIDR